MRYDDIIAVPVAVPAYVGGRTGQGYQENEGVGYREPVGLVEEDQAERMPQTRRSAVKRHQRNLWHGAWVDHLPV